MNRRSSVFKKTSNYNQSIRDTLVRSPTIRPNEPIPKAKLYHQKLLTRHPCPANRKYSIIITITANRSPFPSHVVCATLQSLPFPYSTKSLEEDQQKIPIIWDTFFPFFALLILLFSADTLHRKWTNTNNSIDPANSLSFCQEQKKPEGVLIIN